MTPSPRRSDPTGALIDMALLILRLGCRLLHSDLGVIALTCAICAASYYAMIQYLTHAPGL